MFVLPIPHDKVETKTPWVIWAILVVDGLLLIPSLGNDRVAFLMQYGFIGSKPSLMTFFTGMFLHVGLWHYLGNMFFFWIFGRKIEATLGHMNFLAAYLVSGVGGQLLYWWFALHSEIPCVGASGAIAGIAGLYFVLFPDDRFDLNIYLGWWRVKKILSNARVAVGVWIGEQFILAMLTSVLTFSSVAFWAHVGGFAAGAALGGLYCALVPVNRRPRFVEQEIPDPDNVEQPNNLVGLNLSPTSAPLQAANISDSAS